LTARYDQPGDAGSNQRERERVFPNLSGKVAEELGCRALARVVRELIDYLARCHSGA
jgi:hypothetical protein